MTPSFIHLCVTELRCAVSMLDGDLFDKLARIGSMLRKNIHPFGGIQVSDDHITDAFRALTDHTGDSHRGFLPAASCWQKRTISEVRV